MEFSLQKLSNFNVPLEVLPQVPQEAKELIGPERLKALVEYMRVEMTLLKMPFSEMREQWSSLPVWGKTIGWKPPREVSSGNVASWFSGDLPMPVFRLAGAVALLEIRFMQYMVLLRDPKTPDSYMAKHLQLASDHHREIAKEPALRDYLAAYRLIIYARLEKDQRKSKAHEKLFQEYRAVMSPELRTALKKDRKKSKDHERLCLEYHSMMPEDLIDELSKQAPK